MSYSENIAKFHKILEIYTDTPSDEQLARQTIEAYHSVLQDATKKRQWDVLFTDVEQIEAIIAAHWAGFQINKSLAATVQQFYYAVVSYVYAQSRLEELLYHVTQYEVFWNEIAERYATDDVIRQTHEALEVLTVSAFEATLGGLPTALKIKKHIASVLQRLQYSPKSRAYTALLARLYAEQGLLEYNDRKWRYAKLSYAQSLRIYQELALKTINANDILQKIAFVQSKLSEIEEKMKS
jgi:hypothetical protein